MSRSCTCRRYDGQDVDRGAPRARDPCTNAPDRPGDTPSGVYVGVATVGRRSVGERPDPRDRCDHAGSQRRIAKHRAPRHGRGVRRLVDATRGGVRDRHPERVPTPGRGPRELARFDRKRKKKGANDDWTNPHDPDAKITKLKDGRTHLAHTAEHAVDLETGAVVGVTVQDADDGDTTTMVETLITAAEQVEAVLPAGAGITEVVGDKGYHSNDTMVAFADLRIRSYVSEPDRGRRNWKGKAAAREAVYANRRRIRGTRGQRLLRQRGERLERPNAHLYETGRMRRVHLRGHPNILKRVLVHICGFNLGLLMRQLTGIGTPRSLQGRAAAAFDALMASRSQLWTLVSPSWARDALDQPYSSRVDLVTGWHEHMPIDLRIRASTTGC